MALVTWNNGMSVGVLRIDQQHQKLIEVINDLHEAISAGKGDQVHGALFMELVDYFTRNFDTEEELMRQHAYPELEDHRRLHEGFTVKIRELRDRAGSGERAISEEALRFLMDWLLRHDISVDKKLGAFLNERGIK
jgi:hemerythrin